MTKLQRITVATIVALTAFGWVGCDRSTPPGSATASSAATAGATPSAASPRTSASVAAPASSPSAAVVSPDKATKWTGTYEATKAKLETPEKVKDLTWTKDDGTAAVGPGKITLQVRGTTVEGSATGALGDQIVSGVFDGKDLRLTLTPRDPTVPGAMTGSGMAELKGGKLDGKLRCLGPDAVVVRKVTFQLAPEG